MRIVLAALESLTDLKSRDKAVPLRKKAVSISSIATFQCEAVATTLGWCGSGALLSRRVAVVKLRAVPEDRPVHLWLDKEVER